MRTTRSKSGIPSKGKRTPKAGFDVQDEPNIEPQNPISKRARKVTASNKDKKPTGTGAPKKPAVEQTSKLMRMPLDIWFEILKLLDIATLHALSHTCTQLRDTLVSPQAAGIWKTARGCLGSCPTPPPGTSETRMADLILGGNRCQVRRCMALGGLARSTRSVLNCGRASVDIDWQLLMRVCAPCMRVHSFNSKKFQREFPGEDASVLPLVLYTEVDQGWSSPTTYFWRSDVERMLGIVARYKSDISAKTPGAQAAYNEFRERRIARVLSVMQSAPQYKSWHAEVRSDRGRELAKLAEERKAAIRARLLQIGHDPRDVEHVMTNGDIEIEQKELADASWRRIKKKWETQVAKARRRRLATDHPGHIGQRKRAAARVYNETYHKNVAPREWFTLEWLTLPPSHEVVKLEPLWESVYADVDADVPDTAYQKALRACASAIRKHKSDNMYRVRCAFDDVPKEVLKGGVLLEDIDAQVDVLDLAVTTCRGRWRSYPPFSEQCLSAKEYLLRRSYCMEDYDPEYCADLSRVVVALLEAVNLSPATTTFAELDQLDPRFFCSLCPSQEFGGTWTRLSFKWRSAVLHHNEHHVEKQDSPKFRLLSATEADHARKNESPELAEAKTWSCAHCDEHLDNWQPQLDVEAHVRKRHHIAAPKVGADVLCMPVVLVNVKPVRVSVNSPLVR